MKVNAILATVLSIATVAFAAPAESAALEERQLLGALNNVLCPISGTPLCSAQCLLIRQIEGQCSPSGYVELVLCCLHVTR